MRCCARTVFEFIEDHGKYHVYGRRSDNLVLAIKGDKFVDINDNKPVFAN